MNLEIVYLSPHDLTPYEGNTRKHNPEDIDGIKKSILDVGFADPIGIWGKDNLIVEGHGRQLAAIELGLEKVPCIRLDEMTDEQRREYAIRHNRSAEMSAWDFGKLEEELAALEIQGIDMSDLKFDLDMNESKEGQDDNDGYFGDERERTYNAMRLNEFDADRSEGQFDMPIVPRCEYVPESLTPFNYLLSTEKPVDTVHFFIDDYQFERIWVEPMKYAEILKRKARAVCMPDFSLYTDMPEAGKIWNCFRSKLIAQIFSDAGLTVIPAPTWAQEKSFAYCFDGLPKRSVLMISTRGIHNNGTETLEIWKQGTTEVLKRLKPTMILQYGQDVPGFDYGVPVKKYESFMFSGDEM